MMKTMAVLAMLAAAPVFAVSVQIDSFDGPFSALAGQGNLDVGPATGSAWSNLGYGAPTLFQKASDNLIPPMEGTDAQGYYVPGTAYNTDPDGNAFLANYDGSINNVDWPTWVTAQTGIAPDLGQPAYVTADILMVADSLDDYDTAKVTYDTWFDDAGIKTNTAFDLLANPLANGVWQNDVVLLTYSVFPTDDGMPAIFLDFAINNDSAGDLYFYIDDLTFHYVPEPASALLLGLGLVLVRRRR